MTAYYRQPNLTAMTMADGFVRTGDIGFLDHEGFLMLVDRTKDIIVTGGENVFSTEVEQVLVTHPDVMQVAVIGVPDSKWGERVHACVVLHREVNDEDLICHCRAALAGYKVPKSIERVKALPITAANKIDKNALRAPHWRGHSRRIA
jgi:long-chain acyl-CoA synthetase